MTPKEARELERYLTQAERDELTKLIAEDMAARIWAPLPGPQTMAYESTADIVGYGGAAGGGKGLALDTLLPTPTGWTTMGAAAVGDVLFDQDGRPCTVTAVSDMAMRDCYRLTFDDGSTLVADDVHRWVTFDATELADLTRKDPEWKAVRRAKRPSRATGNKSAAFMAAIAASNSARAAASKTLQLPTGTMRDTSAVHATLRTASGRANHAIKVAGALDTPDAALIVPPYTLGAWLGDGASASGQITGIDDGVWARIEADGFKVSHHACSAQSHSILGLKVLLREIGVLGRKHIPQAYMRASAAQRLALLQGLMDTDGHAALDGGCEFDNTREVLVDGVLELVHSLGIKATKRQGVAKLDGRVIGPKWRVKFTTTLPVFGLARKLARQKTETRRTAQFRYLVACERVPTVPTRCIAVDSPTRQYLAGTAMVPTHNTDLIAGLVLCEHKRCAIFRREKAQTEGVIQRLAEILDGTDGFNGQKAIWRIDADTLCEFAGLDNPGDERRWQGRPHDLKAFDEVTEQREQQVRFVMGWTRSPDPKQRTRVMMTFNPPTTAEGRWVIAFFGPWLDKTHPMYPTPPGELRYAAMLPDERGNSSDVWLTRPDPFVLIDGKREYDFDPDDFTPEQIIVPKSRTFVPARLTDNPYYMESGYMSTLQSLPEPLRSQMLYGDFQAGVKDDPWQVIPTLWVEAAQARWRPVSPKGEMLALGVDVARGGADNTVLVPRHQNAETRYWFDTPQVHAGTETPNGPAVAGLVVSTLRDHAPILIDVIGVGASPYDTLNGMDFQVMGVNVSEKSNMTDKSGRLRFFNLRSQLWWNFRELLDPANDTGAALPPDPQLARELCTPRWTVSGSVIKVESRDEIIASLRKSPDMASAAILAQMDLPKLRVLRAARGQSDVTEYDPFR